MEGVTTMYNIVEHNAAIITCKKKPIASGNCVSLRLRTKGLRPTDIYTKRRRADVKGSNSRDGQNNGYWNQRDCVGDPLPFVC